MQEFLGKMAGLSDEGPEFVLVPFSGLFISYPQLTLQRHFYPLPLQQGCLQAGEDQSSRFLGEMSGGRVEKQRKFRVV